MFEHILIHSDKSTHISLIGMYYHIHNDNTVLQYNICFYKHIHAITEWIIAKYINIHGDISIFIISFHM